MDVTSYRAIVRENTVVAYYTIVSHVRVAEEEVVISYFGRCIRNSGAMNGAALAEGITISYDEVSRSACVFKVLSVLTYRGKWVECIFFANGGVSIDHDMRFQHTVITNSDVVIDDAVGTDADVFSDSGGV